MIGAAFNTAKFMTKACIVLVALCSSVQILQSPDNSTLNNFQESIHTSPWVGEKSFEVPGNGVTLGSIQ